MMFVLNIKIEIFNVRTNKGIKNLKKKKGGNEVKKLWYSNEAKNWEEALPIGNGRIGTMVFSGVFSDKLQINEETLWSGRPNMEKSQHTMRELEKIRGLVKDKKYPEATKAVSDIMPGKRSQGYISYGSIYIDILNLNGETADYRRELDMENGIVKCTYIVNGINVKKEYFVSQKDDVAVINISTDNKCNIHIYQAIEPENRVYTENGILTSEGRCPTELSQYTNKVLYENDKESVHFCSRLKAVTADGQFAGGNSLWVKGTQNLTLIFSIKTSFNGYDKMPVSEGREYINSSLLAIENAVKYSYDELKERHILEYKKYFDRVDFSIDGDDFSDIPTDQRIKRAADGIVDNELVTLLFDYSRYLTICSSAEYGQPSNLQGIWNYHLIAPWQSNYTMNINTQMNYWAVETCNLPEFHMPLMKMLKEFCEKGNNFGLRGWSSWHNSDIWRFNHEATSTAMCGFWPMGGFWASRHIWEHFIHTNDKNFLAEYYPVMTSACEFLEDWMTENENGELTTCPSTSPENQFIFNGEECAVCEGSAMDMSIIYDLFDKTVKASAVLGKDSSHYEEMISKLKPVKIGKDGRILEWGEEFKERELGHRHISHLYGFYPSDIMNGNEYVDAVRESLRVRLENGGGHTGWSNAWIACVYARLGEGENVMKHIRNMFKKSIYTNMFDAHPPFQIDGNFGIAAAICECLMQSHTGTIKLLPALPDEWKSGHVKGFVSRTGETVDFSWRDGKIIEK